MTYGVTDTGFEIKSLQTLIAEADALSITLFGTNIDTTDSSPLGKINQTSMTEMSIYWEKMNNVYLAAFLDSATGDNLDKIVEPLGVTRKPAVRSTGFVVFTGTEGTTIPGSTGVETDEDVPIEFKTDTSLVISDVVTNGEFTTNTTSWTAENAATLASVAGGKDGNCLQVTCDGTNNPYAEQTITVEEYNFYDLSVFIKAGTAGTYNVNVYDESNSADIYLSGDLTESTGDWSVEVSEQIEIPEDCTSISIRLIHRATAGDGTTMLFDTCKFTHVSSAITAVDTGTSGDVATGTIVVMSSPISGITAVTNPNATSDGAAKETDVALRVRTKLSIGAGGKATLNAIVAEVLAVDNVTSVTIEENDTDTDYLDMLTNSGFDTDTSSWTAGHSAVLASIAGGEDGNCLRITGNGAVADPYAYQAVTVVADANYTLTVYIKAGTEATYNVKVYDVSNSAYIYESGDIEETAGDWTTSDEETFTAPSGCTSVRVELYQIAAAATTTMLFDTAILNGLPPHSVRVSVSGGTDNDVAQALLDSVAAGIRAYGDDSGIGTIDNDQSFTRYFTRPDQKLIYVSATITSDDTYAGNDAVETAIISYIGGVDVDTVTHIGIGAGADVVFYEVVCAIMDVTGVTNVTDLKVGTVSPPTGTTDIDISSTEVSYASTTSVVIS